MASLNPPSFLRSTGFKLPQYGTSYIRYHVEGIEESTLADATSEVNDYLESLRLDTEHPSHLVSTELSTAGTGNNIKYLILVTIAQVY